MRTTLRIVALLLTGLIGLWALGRGIVVAVEVRTLLTEQQAILNNLVEASIFIAGGICVLSVAVQQLYCWRTHRKSGGLL